MNTNIEESFVKKGGHNDRPKTPKPDVVPPSQLPKQTILCKLGIHRPLFGHKSNFTDVVSGKMVCNAECSCGILWMTDSRNGWLGTKMKRPFQKSLTLSDLKPGEKGIITAITCKGELAKRLAELGLNKGEEIKLERFAPLDDPIALKVRGYHVSVGRSVGKTILIKRA
jgi:ferrous iron transport protein A